MVRLDGCHTDDHPRWRGDDDGRRVRMRVRVRTTRLGLTTVSLRLGSLPPLLLMVVPRDCRSLRTTMIPPAARKFSSSPSWSCGGLGLGHDLPDLVRGVRGRGGRRRPSFARLRPLAASSSSTYSSRTSSSSKSSSNYYRIDPTALFNQDIERVATSSAEDAAERADEMLAHMERLHDDGSRTVKPNAVGFALVLEAYARRAKRAHSRLLRPSSVSSSRGGEEDGVEGGKKRKKELKRARSVLVTCADRVDDLHRRMKLRLPLLDDGGGEVFVDGEGLSDEEIEALRRCHVAILDICRYSSRCDHESAPRAEALLDEMTSLNLGCGDDNGGNDTWPNVDCYRRVLEAYSDRRCDDSPVIASRLLRRMLGDDDDAFPSRSEESSGTVAPPPPPSTPMPRPDVGCYGAVIRNWSRSRIENAAEEGDRWLRRMIDEGHTPNVDIYAPVILALVRRTDVAPGEDDDAASGEEDDGDDGGGSVGRKMRRRPNRGVKSRSRVVEVGSIRRATELLHAATKSYISELDDEAEEEPPGLGTLEGEREGADDAAPGNNDGMVAGHDAIASSTAAATTAAESLKLCFNAVIGAWGNSGGGWTEGAERAQSLLDRMEGLRHQILGGGDGDGDDAGGGRRADRSSSSPPVGVVVEPDVVTYNSVMNAWAKSIISRVGDGRRGRGGAVGSEHHRLGVANLAAAERCESILRRMIEGGEASARPDGISFATAIHAWTRCCSSSTGSGTGVGGGDGDDHGDVSPAARAEALLNELERLYRDARAEQLSSETTTVEHLDGDDDGDRDHDRPRRRRREYVESLRPNVMHHSAVIQAHAESCDPESAETLLRRMEESDGDDGDDDDAVPKPDVVCYTTVIDAWARVSGGGHGYYAPGEASGRACAILDRMLDAKQGLGLVPNVRTYTAVVRAISNDRCKGMARRARDVVDRMEVEATATTPNIYTYNNLLNACANTPVDASVEERGEALSIAVDAFRTVLSDSSSSSPPLLRPDSFTYAFFLKACANLMPEGDRRDAVARRAFRRCCLDGRVNQEVLFRYRRALSTDATMSCESRPSVEGDHVPVNDRRPRRTVRPSWLESDVMVSVEDLPREWTRNARRR